jgi:hypothetical protein
VTPAASATGLTEASHNQVLKPVLVNPRIFFQKSGFVRNLFMAKYGASAQKEVKKAMHKTKRGLQHRGKGGKGGKVTSRKQAIAIGLSEARKKGAKVPKKKR